MGSRWGYGLRTKCNLYKCVVNFFLLRGTRQKTKSSGQTKADLMKNKRGKIISKKKYAQGKRVFRKNGMHKWNAAFMQARKNLGITGFVPLKKGTKLYNATMKLYKK